MGIETRPIISGNFLKQPSVIKYKLNKKGRMKNAELVNNRGFFIGLPTNKMTSSKIKKLVNLPFVAFGCINEKNYKKLLLNKADFLAISGYIWNNKKYKPHQAIKNLK